MFKIIDIVVVDDDLPLRDGPSGDPHRHCWRCSCQVPHDSHQPVAKIGASRHDMRPG
jgi:hypothetical protein